MNREDKLKYLKEWRTKNKDYKRMKAKEYYQKNKEEILNTSKEYYFKNRVEKIIYKRNMDFKYPWKRTFFNARNRCTNKNFKNFDTYGQRGIKFLLTLQEIEEIWFRDKAFLLKRPSIDRIDNDGNYEFSNCRFIEQSENSTKGNLEARWK